MMNQGTGKQARWRVRNESLEFSSDGIRWAPDAMRLSLNSTGSPVLQSHDKEYVQCD
jgi:hypothetical protein